MASRYGGAKTRLDHNRKQELKFTKTKAWSFKNYISYVKITENQKITL